MIRILTASALALIFAAGCGPTPRNNTITTIDVDPSAPPFTGAGGGDPVRTVTSGRLPISDSAEPKPLAGASPERSRSIGTAT